MSDIKPIAMTLGEPGGIGPELAIKAWLGRSRGCPSRFGDSR